MHVKIIISCLFIVYVGIYLPIVTHAMNASINDKLYHYIHTELSSQGSLVGVSVRSQKSGDILYEFQGDTRLTPASNLKLLTAAAALDTLGENYTFKTKWMTDGKQKWNILNGNLYIQGGGDPTLLVSDIEAFAKHLKSLGVRFITGDIIGDDTRFDQIRYSIDLPWSDETMDYGSPISALTVSPTSDYDTGTVIVKIFPGLEEGKAAIIETIPQTNYIKILNKTNTVEKAEHSLQIRRIHGTNIVEIEGELSLSNEEAEEKLSVWEPTEFVAHITKEALEREGIIVLGKPIRGDVPQEATEIESHYSNTLSNILIPFMKYSNNGHAEMLVKEMGKVVMNNGSWESGISVIKNKLEAMGSDVEKFVIRDGSGISHVDLVTANELTKLLYEVQKKEWFSSYYTSLPTAGKKEKLAVGTLKGRMAERSLAGKIQAKTGTLSTVSSLSGYLITEDDEHLIFSIIINHVTEDTPAKKLEDTMVEIISGIS